MSPLKLLLLEDNPLDAEVVHVTLADGGIECELQVVETRSQFEAALATEPFDLILVDYAQPGFDGLTVLDIVQHQCPNVPFIFVTATLGEEMAIESLKLGATDYVLKHRLARLVPCVERALREAQERRDRTAAEATLEANLRDTERLRKLGTRLVGENDIQTLYEEILDTAIALMQADGGAIQFFDAATEELVAIAARGFNRKTAERFCRTNVHSKTVYGQALASNQQVFIDYEVVLREDPGDDWRMLLEAGYQSAHSKPLIAFSGQLMGMFCAYWHEQRQPSMRELSFLDLLARQAADLIEQQQAKANLAANLTDTQRLRDLAVRMVGEDDIQTLYEDILDLAIALMQANGGVIQVFDAAAEDLVLLVARGFDRSLTDGFLRVNAHSKSVCGRALAANQRVLIDYEVALQEEPGEAWQVVLEAGYRLGQATPLISRSGRLIGMISTYWHEAHRVSDRELYFLDLLARQAADLVAQWQDKNALRESEAKYSSLFNSIDEGFGLCEILLDEQGVPQDYRFLETNPAFEFLTGLPDPVGKTALELVPDLEDFWIETYGRVALTREPIRFENHAETLQRWFDVYAFAVGAPQEHLFGILFTDITARKAIEWEREQFLAVGSDLQVIADSNGYFQWVSPTCETVLGWAVEEVLLKPWIELVHPDDVFRTMQEAEKLFAGAETFAFENRYRHKDGSYRWLLWKGRPDLQRQLIYSTAMDITPRKQAEEALQRYNEELEAQVAKRTAELSESLRDLEISRVELHRRAHHDALTGLPNRILFQLRLEQSLHQATRQQTKVAVVFMDLDRFKLINDSFGHRLGDALLQQVAHRLREVLRGNDTIGRIGGDEFVAVLTNIEKSHQVVNAVSRIMTCFASPFDLEGQVVQVTTSLGLCLFPDDGTNTDVLLRNADAAMYNAKADGRNTYCFYDAAMTTAAHEQLSLENALREALRQGELSLVYQPQIDLQSFQVVGVEALLRWHHPEWGSVSPNQFIPIAERSGLIHDIGTWVVQQACLQAKAWVEQGLHFGCIAINVAAPQFKHEKFIQVIESALTTTNLPPHHLELEVTESLLMENAEVKIQIMEVLRQLGIQLAVDDFGTGYSSLSYLKLLPIDKLKIDQSFVRDIPQDPNDMAITEAIIALGRALDIKVIAEGVETEAQTNFLKEQGCQEAQGYFYSHPLPPDELEQLLRQFPQKAFKTSPL